MKTPELGSVDGRFDKIKLVGDAIGPTITSISDTGKLQLTETLQNYI